MKKYIHITKEDREFIMKALGVTERFVFNVTHFDDIREGSELVKKARKLALDRGGIVMVQLPEVECFHDADDYLRLYLPNDTLLELSKEDGSCDVYHKGEKVRRYEGDVAVSSIKGIQEWAMALR